VASSANCLACQEERPEFRRERRCHLVWAWVECEICPVGTVEMGLIRVEPHETVPLWVDEEHGVVRIPGTRLTLETVIHMYYEGFTEPEGMPPNPT